MINGLINGHPGISSLLNGRAWPATMAAPPSSQAAECREMVREHTSFEAPTGRERIGKPGEEIACCKHAAMLRTNIYII